jgi:hypothetical protein
MYEGEWNDICEYCDDDSQHQPQGREEKEAGEDVADEAEIVMLCRHCNTVAHTRCARARGFERYVYDDSGEEDWVCDTCYPQLYIGVSQQPQQPQQ